MWHFSMQGLPAVAVTSNGRGLLPHIFTFTRHSLGEGGQLFSVALSLSVLAEAGYSPVHCSVLSGLSSFLINQESDNPACSYCKSTPEQLNIEQETLLHFILAGKQKNNERKSSYTF